MSSNISQTELQIKRKKISRFLVFFFEKREKSQPLFGPLIWPARAVGPVNVCAILWARPSVFTEAVSPLLIRGSGKCAQKKRGRTEPERLGSSSERTSGGRASAVLMKRGRRCGPCPRGFAARCRVRVRCWRAAIKKGNVNIFFFKLVILIF